MVRDGRIATPGHANDILDGISRKSVMQIAADLGYEVVERDIARSELVLADEVFLTGTAAELVPVREMDDHEVGPPGEVTRAIQSAFDDALHGRDQRYADWLDLAGGAFASVTGARGHVALYDTTLRDGMQGEGLSLSADEKVRVAHALDGLGVGLIEAGFPSSNPKEQAVFDLLAAETFETAEVGRLRHDPPAATPPPRTIRRSERSPRRSRPSARWSGRPGGSISRR